MNNIFCVTRRNSTTSHYQSSADSKIRKVFKSLVRQSASGTNTSAGLAVVTSKPTIVGVYAKPGHIKVYKDFGDVEVFLKSPKYVNLVNSLEVNTTSLMGKVTNHGRRVTTGNHDAQPFIHGMVVGVTSGFVKNTHTLAKKHSLTLKGSDSGEIIVALVDKFMSKERLTLQSAIKKATDELEGAYASIVTSLENYGVLGAFRNGHPLYARYRRIGGVLLMSDSEQHLRQAFSDSEWETGMSPHYVEMNELVIPDRTGFILNPNISGYSNEWVEKNKGFSV